MKIQTMRIKKHDAVFILGSQPVKKPRGFRGEVGEMAVHHLLFWVFISALTQLLFEKSNLHIHCMFLACFLHVSRIYWNYRRACITIL